MLLFGTMQGDVWNWFLEPSLYGTDILTLGGSRGPSVSYYVPYLSAMQLLLPVPEPDSPASQQPDAKDGAEADAPASLQLQPSAEELGQAERSEVLQQSENSKLPRTGRLYHIKDEWQHRSTQVNQ